MRSNWGMFLGMSFVLAFVVYVAITVVFVGDTSLDAPLLLTEAAKALVAVGILGMGVVKDIYLRERDEVGQREQRAQATRTHWKNILAEFERQVAALDRAVAAWRNRPQGMSAREENERGQRWRKYLMSLSGLESILTEVTFTSTRETGVDCSSVAEANAALRERLPDLRVDFAIYDAEAKQLTAELSSQIGFLTTPEQKEVAHG